MMIKKQNLTDLVPKKLGELEMRTIPFSAGDGLTVLHEALPPNADSPSVIHDRTTEFVFVYKGRVRATVGGDLVELNKGDFLSIPPGTTHHFRAGMEGAEAISLFVPGIDPANPDGRIV